MSDRTKKEAAARGASGRGRRAAWPPSVPLDYQLTSADNTDLVFIRNLNIVLLLVWVRGGAAQPFLYTHARLPTN